VNDLAKDILRTRVRFPPPPPSKEKYDMFEWFKRKMEKKTTIVDRSNDNIEDALELSLWEIKEEYDFPTEEIIGIVQTKRENMEHMHKMLSNKENPNRSSK
jgi:hypothetical protein